MTLIAFATHGDHAEILTDTTSYTVNGSSLAHCTKILTMPHLDAAVLAQGDAAFGTHAKVTTLEASGQVGTFDELVESAPSWLNTLWEALEPPGDAFVVLVGYSTAQDRFAAYLYASDDGFTQTEVTETWAHPMPFSARPTDLELARHRKRPGAKNMQLEIELGAIAAWQSKPPLPRHHGVSDWRHLAKTIREQRALTEYGRVFVAGSVLYTRLERGQMTTRKIHEFDDHGEEFLQMIAWTFHPIAQLMACHCGSGERFVDCHLARFHDEPCTCGMSGKTFAECCMVGGA